MVGFAPIFGGFGSGGTPGGGGGGGWTPDQLFLAAEAGAWFDPSDASTVWQDDSATTPAAENDPVGRIDDQSGNGNHATQPTAADRPILRKTAGGLWYLEFDGVQQLLTANGLAGIGNDNSLVFGATPNEAPSNNSVAMGWNSSSTANRLYIYPNDNVSGTGGFRMWRETSLNEASGTDQNGVTQVLSTWAKVSDQGARRNGVEIMTATSGTSISPAKFWIGTPPAVSQYFKMHLYALIVRGGKLSVSEFGDAEAWAADKAGVTL